MRIIAFTNNTGSKLWRFYPQKRLLEQLGWEFRIVSYEDFSLDIIKDFDLVIVEMFYSKQGKVIDSIHKQGKPVIYEIDDVIEDVPEGHPGFPPDTEKTQALLDCLRKVDAITTTTEQIKEKYQSINKNIYVLPNYLDLEIWENDIVIPKIKNEIRIGWIGSTSHKPDLEMIKPVLERVICCKRKFVHMGYGGASGGLLTEYLYGKDIFKGLAHEYVMGALPEQYPSKIKTLALDIGLAPLVDNKFNHYKTPCKWLEYSINKIPGIYSKVVYSRVVQHGVDGFLAGDLAEWEKYLRILIDKPDLRKRIAENAYQRAKNDFNIVDYIEEWLKVYEEVVKTNKWH